MRDLYRLLDEYPPILLEAIAEAWDISLPKGEPLDVVRALGDGMLAPGAVEKALRGLSAEAREALAELKAQGGAVPAPRLTMRFGNLRRFGPARLARERPWGRPANALEELYYRGLVFRAYGEMGDYYGDMFLIPQQLLERLPPLAVQTPEWDQPLPSAPQGVRSAGRSLVEDLFSLLVALRRAPLEWPQPDEVKNPILPVLDRLTQTARLLGPRDPWRDALLWRLMARLEIVRAEGGGLQPSLKAREWLRLTDEERARGLYIAWREDPALDELTLGPTLRCEGGALPARAAAMRRNLATILARFPAGPWFGISGFLNALRRYRPDFMRPEGDSGWYLRDVATGRYLDGPESWEQVEGVVAPFLLTTALHWLGIVDLGYEEGASAPVAFRVTPEGHRLLAEERPEKTAVPPFRERRPAPREPLATVDEEMTIAISQEDSLYERYQLERFAEWRAQDGRALYRITEDSIWRSQEAGIRIEQIVQFLRRITANRVPPPVLRTLEVWKGRFGRASLSRMIVLQTVDAQTMAQIRADAQAAALLGVPLGPTACQVPEERVEALIARLKALEIWPRVRLKP